MADEHLDDKLIPEYEQNLDKMFSIAFDTDHPAMLDWVAVKFELKELRKLKQLDNPK